MSEQTVIVIGAGTMGAGIAQVAATAGWTVYLRDVDAAVVREGVEQLTKRLARMVEKGRMSEADAKDAAARVHPLGGDDDMPACSLVIEAIVEDMDVKARVFREVSSAAGDDVILATNTSSLSVTGLSERLDDATRGRVVGMHFFNPAPIMKLVELVKGAHTSDAIADRAAAIAESWGKKVARAADVPGFIVNHVARPYYLEAFRIFEEGLAMASEIDDVMVNRAGFRMGPLALTDLIGQDVNAATTRSVWEQLDRPPLLKPSVMQEALVSQGDLGRKSGRGVYDYSGDGEPVLSPRVPTVDLSGKAAVAPDGQLVDAAVAFMERATGSRGSDSRLDLVAARILAAIMLQAKMARRRGVASEADIDTAMKFGVNYPRGPFEWMEMIGDDVFDTFVGRLEAAGGEGVERFALAGER